MKSSEIIAFMTVKGQSGNKLKIDSGNIASKTGSHSEQSQTN
jgi:hypothetical protein